MDGHVSFSNDLKIIIKFFINFEPELCRKNFFTWFPSFLPVFSAFCVALWALKYLVLSYNFTAIHVRRFKLGKIIIEINFGSCRESINQKVFPMKSKFYGNVCFWCWAHLSNQTYLCNIWLTEDNQNPNQLQTLLIWQVMLIICCHKYRG